MQWCWIGGAALIAATTYGCRWAAGAAPPGVRGQEKGREIGRGAACDSRKADQAAQHFGGSGPLRLRMLADPQAAQVTEQVLISKICSINPGGSGSHLCCALLCARSPAAPAHFPCVAASWLPSQWWCGLLLVGNEDNVSTPVPAFYAWVTKTKVTWLQLPNIVSRAT